MTAVAVQPAPRYATPPTPRVRRFTVDEYHRLIEDGYFAHDERFELLEGWIVAKVSRNPIHDAALSIAMKVLDRVMPTGWHARVQSGFTTADSEPEPDLAIVRGDERDYTARHPGPADAALVIEVANTSLPEDRDLKARVYARANVGVYWIINLTDRVIEVFTDPSGPAPSPAYAKRQQFTIGESVPLVIPGAAPLAIPVTDFMP
jgi:Uma2 family endonuclease